MKLTTMHHIFSEKTTVKQVRVCMEDFQFFDCLKTISLSIVS